LFYRNSSFDSPSDNAIAPDKSPLLPGQTATFANYSSYSLGINGIMLDYAGPAINFFATDFVFNVGNNSTPASWIGASAPVSVTVRPGAGVGGSTRIEIAWIDATIQQQWLQITFKGGAGATSGLDASDVFYFGNAIAESGNSPTDTKVDAIDQLAPRAGATTGALITNPLDYDRDGIVGSQDEVIARNCFTYFINQLQLITPPGPPPAPPAAAALPILAPAQPLGGVGRTFSLAPLSSTAISGEWFPLARIKMAPPAKKIHLAVIKPPTRKLS
ncbi:MAG TPA: hypothetical protein VHM90_18180, partial [Phycisphaerae bacterium]|nr:hypothetical protein [Phycisphaerae bacterium]